MGFQMFDRKEWEQQLINEQDNLRREWREYEQSPQYKMEHQYRYPIGPELSNKQWKEFISEMYGEKWFYVN